MKLVNWFRRTEKVYPEFWKSYLAYFDFKSNASAEKRIVAFDTETTGLDFRTDVILSIGAIGISGNSIVVNDCLNLFLIQDVFKKETVPIHGILKTGQEEKIPESEAVIKFLDFIKDAVLVGHHVSFDVKMINEVLKRMGLSKLKNKSIDTDLMYQKFKRLPEEHHSSLDELCKIFKIEKIDRHTAIGDAYITAFIYLQLKNKWRR
ncbi:exonuclease domain-containing protein [Flavobacterium sp. PL12]|uniref:3'-5' exonuclease n=1 Tax=Flavobacterium sp. PL12 TaxID=3071718 RepID=UPI00319EB794